MYDQKQKGTRERNIKKKEKKIYVTRNDEEQGHKKQDKGRKGVEVIGVTEIFFPSVFMRLGWGRRLHFRAQQPTIAVFII